MATLEEMQKLGYGPKQNGMQQIASLLSGYNDQNQKQVEQKSKDVQDQVKLYTTLREAGYSSEDATARVNRTYRSTGFLEEMMSGKRDENVFNPSSAEDKTGLDTEKTKADIAKTKADAVKSNAQADYYKGGGAAGRNYSGLTPNQIQMRIKDIRSQLGTGTPEDDTAMQSEIDYLNELFNKKSGFGNAPDAAANAAGGAGEKVIMSDPKTGKKYRVVKANVEAAKKLGLQ